MPFHFSLAPCNREPGLFCVRWARANPNAPVLAAKRAAPRALRVCTDGKQYANTGHPNDQMAAGVCHAPPPTVTTCDIHATPAYGADNRAAARREPGGRWSGSCPMVHAIVPAPATGKQVLVVAHHCHARFKHLEHIPPGQCLRASPSQSQVFELDSSLRPLRRHYVEVLPAPTASSHSPMRGGNNA
jgi:hypothetical protein